MQQRSCHCNHSNELNTTYENVFFFCHQTSWFLRCETGDILEKCSIEVQYWWLFKYTTQYFFVCALFSCDVVGKCFLFPSAQVFLILIFLMLILLLGSCFFYVDNSSETVKHMKMTKRNHTRLKKWNNFRSYAVYFNILFSITLVAESSPLDIHKLFHCRTVMVILCVTGCFWTKVTKPMLNTSGGFDILAHNSHFTCYCLYSSN